MKKERKDYDKYVAVCSGCYKEWDTRDSPAVHNPKRIGNCAVGKPLQKKGFLYCYCIECSKEL